MIQINQNQKNKIPDSSGLVKRTEYNTKTTEIEGKTRNVSNLATKNESTTVKNKIPSVSSLVNKKCFNTKITEIENKLNNHNHDKYITTPEFNTLAANGFGARLAQSNLVVKTSFDNTVSSLDSKFETNKKKMSLLKRN